MKAPAHDGFLPTQSYEPWTSTCCASPAPAMSGSPVAFDIPRSSTASGAPGSQHAPRRSAHTASLDFGGPQRATKVRDAPHSKILLIDDEVRTDDAIVRLLSSDDFTVECVDSGMRGLRRALATKYDAILLDLRLPDVPGLVVLQQLRGSDVVCPVIVVTGWYSDPDHEIVARRLGACEVMRKPLDAGELAWALRTAIKVPNVSVRVRDQSVPTPSGIDGAPTEPADARSLQFVAQSADLSTLHKCLCNGDHVAGNLLATQLLPLLVKRLRRSFPRSADDARADAAEDAFLEYAAHPTKFDPSRGVPLEGYLFCAARRNLINYLDREQRRRMRESRYATQIALARRIRDPYADAGLALRVKALLPALVVDDSERRALRLWLEGERRTAAFAQALGLSHLPRSLRKNR